MTGPSTTGCDDQFAPDPEMTVAEIIAATIANLAEAAEHFRAVADDLDRRAA